MVRCSQNLQMPCDAHRRAWHMAALRERRSRYGEGSRRALQWFASRLETGPTTLFRRSGWVVAAADALTSSSAARLTRMFFALLDDVEHRADSNTHDLLSRLGAVMATLASERHAARRDR